jgi:Putative peptidoglycan binding domain
MLDNPEHMKSELNQQEIKNEFDLKVAEHVLRLEEFKTKLQSERRNIWFTSPLLITFLSAFFGLMGTAVGAALQGYWNTKLERQKFESTLVLKSLEATDKNEIAKNLKFMVDAGLISNLDREKITSLANDPSRLPIYFPSTGLTVREAKTILKKYGFYNGEINDSADIALMESIKKFQASKGLLADGLLGPMTAKILKDFSQDKSN